MTDQDGMTARWHVAQDGDTLTVCIALSNGHGVVLAARKDDAAAPVVALHNGEFQHALTECDFRSFRAWLDGARRRPARQRTQLLTKQAK